jgi:hypothetical protein
LLTLRGTEFHNNEFVEVLASYMHESRWCPRVETIIRDHVPPKYQDKLIKEAVLRCPFCRLKIAMRDLVDVVCEMDSIYLTNKKTAKELTKVTEQMVKIFSKEAQKLGICLEAPDKEDFHNIEIRREANDLFN